MSCKGCAGRRERFMALVESYFSRRVDANEPTVEELEREVQETSRFRSREGLEASWHSR